MPAMSASPLTPLDYIAEGYWQDFLVSRPIAGGIAYEAELPNCQLDESLASLQRIDTLLSQIRRDMVKAGTWDETALLADEHYRNLLVFLAFYAGRVLARQWQNVPHWYGQFELRARYPELPLITDDFYQYMAVLYNDTSVFIAATQGINSNESEGNNRDESDRADSSYQNPNYKNNHKALTPVFFALEPIGLRLFGHIDRQFEAVQGGQVASGLYQAVSARLPNVTADPVNADHTLKPATSPADKVSMSTTLEAVTVAGSSVDETQTKPILTKNLSSTPSSLPKTTVPPKVTLMATIAPPTPEIFTQLLTELDEIEVVQTVGNDDYQQARKILDQFEQHIAKQNKPRAQVVFSESHRGAKQQALIKLKNSADIGNTAAMLRLAMYELLGEGLTMDNDEKGKDAGIEAGIDWVKKAAHKKDSRAQRLLSRMYYQGIGLPQDINNGKHWLEQAAENGHTEAAGLVGQWQQAQALMTTRQQEQHSLKRYQLLIGVVIVAALLLIIFV